jgi:hypothetical protein
MQIVPDIRKPYMHCKSAVLFTAADLDETAMGRLPCHG